MGRTLGKDWSLSVEQGVGGSSPPNCTKGIRLPAVPLLDHLEGKSQAPADLTAEYLNLAPSQKQWRHFSFKRTLSCKRAHNLAESLSLWINTSCASFAFLVLCKQ